VFDVRVGKRIKPQPAFKSSEGALRKFRFQPEHCKNGAKERNQPIGISILDLFG